MSSRASTPAGRTGATQRTRRPGPAKSSGSKVAKPRAKSTASKTKPRAKSATKPKAASKAKSTAKAKPKAPITRRAPARRPAAKASRPRQRAARARKPEPTGLLARILRPRNLAIVAVVLVAIAGGYRFWLRDSSLVAVTAVTVSGADGPEADQVEAALKRNGVGMSTLNVDDATLEKAVAGFPTVSGVDVNADFPHGLSITVDSLPPTLLIEAGSKTVPVAGDGTILGGVDTGSEKLPRIKIATLPPGRALTGDPLAEAILTGAAPAPLHELIDKVQFKGEKGVVITIAGLPVIFGTSDRAGEKWVAVAATLSDPKLDSLSYLDVRVPDRPAAGGSGESLADAPDPTTLAPTDIVPAVTDATTAVDPATETTTPPATETQPAATDPAATAPVAPVTAEPVAPTTDTTVPPPAADTPSAATGETGAGGAVVP